METAHSTYFSAISLLVSVLFAIPTKNPIAPFVLELQLVKKKKKKKKKTKTGIFEARLFLSGMCSLAFKVSL